MKIFIRLVLCFTVLFGVMEKLHAAKLYNAKHHTLENGLKIVVIENKNFPVVNVNLVYKVGCGDDPEEIFGISHFLEHLMFKGTKKYPDQVYTKNITKHGGYTNAYTTYDVTVYTTTIGSDHIDLLLDMEADRMQALSFDEKEVVAEQQVVIEERRMRIDNHPFQHAFNKINKALYGDHPYATLTIGENHHILAYTYENAMAHYKKWYGPNNAILIVAGDVDFDSLVKKVEHYFGHLRPIVVDDRKVQKKSPRFLSLNKPVQINAKSKRVANDYLVYYYKGPDYHDTQKDYYAAQMLSSILVGDSSAPLYKALVEDEKLAIHVDMSVPDIKLSPTPYSISIDLKPGASLSKLENKFTETIRHLSKVGITEKQLAYAKKRALNHLAFAMDGMALSYPFVPLAQGEAANDIENWPQLIKAVTLDDVNRVMGEILSRKVMRLELSPES